MPPRSDCAFGNTGVTADEEQRSTSPIVRPIERCLVIELHYGATGKGALGYQHTKKKHLSSARACQ
jgi:hypothetical protein